MRPDLDVRVHVEGNSLEEGPAREPDSAGWEVVHDVRVDQEAGSASFPGHKALDDHGVDLQPQLGLLKAHHRMDSLQSHSVDPEGDSACERKPAETETTRCGAGAEPSRDAVLVVGSLRLRDIDHAVDKQEVERINSVFED